MHVLCTRGSRQSCVVYELDTLTPPLLYCVSALYAAATAMVGSLLLAVLSASQGVSATRSRVEPKGISVTGTSGWVDLTGDMGGSSAPECFSGHWICLA